MPLIPIGVAVVLVASSGGAANGSVAHARLRAIGGSSNRRAGAHARGSVPAAKPKLPTSEVALVTEPTELHASPGGAVIAAQPLKTSFGSVTVLLVERTVGSWLGVVSPLAGNGRLGWISSSAVKVSRVKVKLEVSLGGRELTVLEGASVVERYRIAVGKPSSPTPTGTFAVTDRLQTNDPSGPYGCCILALSALAPHAIEDWDGGNRIAIHSTPDTSTIGEAISHGCMHVTLPEGEWLMEHVPLGTPVVIRSD